MTDIVNGLLVRRQQVLMAKRSPLRQNHPNTWSFPGGHVEENETLEQALIRELTEEIGVLATSWSFMHRFDDQPKMSGDKVTFHFFAVDNWDGDPTNLGDEHTELRWVKITDASKMQNLAFTSYGKLFQTLAAHLDGGP